MRFTVVQGLFFARKQEKMHIIARNPSPIEVREFLLHLLKIVKGGTDMAHQKLIDEV